MKKQGRNVLAIILAAVMTTGLAACGGGNTNSTTAASTESKAAAAETSAQSGTTAAASAASNLPSNVKITLWTDQSISTDAWQAEFSRFAEQYKSQNYSLDIQAFAGSDRSTKMAAAISSNSLPDMGLYAWFTDTDWCHQGYVLDVSDITGKVKDQMYPSVYQETQLNGKSYMVPLWSNYWGMMYNADMLKSAGLEKYVPSDPNEVTVWTMDQFNEILKTVSASMSGNQYCLPLFAADNQADTTNLLFLTMNGGQLWKDGLSDAGTDSKVVSALDTMGGWVKSGYTNKDVVSKSNNDVPSDFTNKLACFSYGYYSNYKDYLKQMNSGSIGKFDIRIAAFPKTDNGKDTYQMANYVYGISAFDTKDTDRETVTKLFLNWLVNDKKAMTDLSMAISSIQSIATDKDVIAANPVFESYAKKIDQDHLNQFHGNVAGYVSTRAMLFPQLQAYFGGSATAQAALTTYMDQANKSIQNYIKNSVILNK